MKIASQCGHLFSQAANLLLSTHLAMNFQHFEPEGEDNEGFHEGEAVLTNSLAHSELDDEGIDA